MKEWTLVSQTYSDNRNRDPVTLMVTNTMEIVLQDLVHLLPLTIIMWVLGGGNKELHLLIQAENWAL